MTTRTEIVVIPEKTYNKTIYIASDGKEFTWENECIQHEKRLIKEKNPVNKTKIAYDASGNYCLNFKEENAITFYYLRDIEDFHNFQDLVNYTFYLPEDTEEDKLFKDKDCCKIHGWIEEYCDFYKFGPGWYMFFCVDGGDWDDEYFCLNWGNYITNLEAELKSYKDNINSLIIKKSNELGISVKIEDLGINSNEGEII